MKSANLSPQHYAARWTAEVRPVKEINELGCEYASLADDNPAKEQKFLEIAQCFHGYFVEVFVSYLPWAFAVMGHQGEQRR